MLSTLTILPPLNRDTAEKVVFCINSPGGEVGAGLAVYDYLRLMKSPVRTVCIGTAASMGSILFLAGDKREMLPHSRIMIHDPAFSRRNCGKKPNEIEEVLKDLSELHGNAYRSILAERTGQPLETIYPRKRKGYLISVQRRLLSLVLLPVS